MKLIDNEAVDLIFAVKRFADRNKQPENNYPRMKELDDWCSEYEKKLSPFLLNDISLLFGKMIISSVYIFMLFRRHHEIKTGADLLKVLEAVKADDFVDYLKKELMHETSDEITEQLIREVLIDDGLYPGYDPAEEASLLYGFLKDPEGLLKRLCNTYSDFYYKVFLPGRESLAEIGHEKYEWHSNRLEEDGKDYLELLGQQSFVKSIGEEGEPVLFFSLFADNETTSFWSIRTIIIGAGTDQRILHRSARDKADIFFSCFGDPKRLEILRLTAQRPWYNTELANHFNLKPATLSYHINILVDAELLDIEKGDSRRFYYSLNKDSVNEYLKYVARDLLGRDYAD